MNSVYSDDKKLAFIGAGNMATALVFGFIHSGKTKPGNITVFDIDKSKYKEFIKAGVKTSDSAIEAARNCDYVFLAVKPNIIAKVVKELFIDNDLQNVVTVSIAASVPIDFICKNAGRAVPVVRIMPSTPMMVGEGAAAICKNELVKKSDFEHICRLLSDIATVSVLDESLMNKVIAVHGSSPAYVYLFINAMLQGAIEQGFTQEEALPLILRTVVGSVKMIKECNCSIEELIKQVASPNGTTLAALNSFEHDDFVNSVKRAMQACNKRADEISEEL